ncbi:venom allergen 5 [Anabrus simplex]|uniref:venom allergen 5 n=1 Tax=Anabrus simplex TaxID=316456 RepID=UPI0034DDA505
MISNCWYLTTLICLFSYQISNCFGIYCNGHKMIQSGGLTCADRQLILDEHNKLRQSLALGKVNGQPRASNMREMVWDDNLAALAQSWADQCTIAHDYSRNDGRFPVGQNLAATWTTRSSISPIPDFRRQINDWFNEVSLFHYGSTGFTVATGHYSQLAWGETYLVGCGYSFYYDKSRGYTKLYICNYGPGGNVVGEEPYVQGPPSCPLYGMSSSSRYQGLCGVQGYSNLGSACSNSISQGFNTDTSNSKFQYNSAFKFYYGR